MSENLRIFYCPDIQATIFDFIYGGKWERKYTRAVRNIGNSSILMTDYNMDGTLSNMEDPFEYMFDTFVHRGKIHVIAQGLGSHWSRSIISSHPFKARNPRFEEKEMIRIVGASIDLGLMPILKIFSFDNCLTLVKSEAMLDRHQKAMEKANDVHPERFQSAYWHFYNVRSKKYYL